MIGRKAQRVHVGLSKFANVALCVLIERNQLTFIKVNQDEYSLRSRCCATTRYGTFSEAKMSHLFSPPFIKRLLELNPGLIRGRDVSYRWTTIACLRKKEF